MEMFEPKSMKERIGDMKKSETLKPLEEVERYFLNRIKRYDFDAAYDVIANEIPYFHTVQYTEYAHCFMMHPLNQEIRVRQMSEAYHDNTEVKIDYAEFLKNNIAKGTANKYQGMKNDREYEYRGNLVVLVGSNVLKKRVCLNKLRYLSKKYVGDIWFKPHPMTTFGLIGELKDLFGEDKILPRNANMYDFLAHADVIHTSHMSESAAYAVALDKKIEPIDVYNKITQGSFYHINKFLFIEKDPKEWLNKTFNSHKSGIICPTIDPDWKAKVDAYLEYIDEIKESYKNKYIDVPQKSDDDGEKPIRNV